MCRNHQQEDAAFRMIVWCIGGAIVCLLLATAFHTGVKKQAYGEGQRCVEQAERLGWIKPGKAVRP